MYARAIGYRQTVNDDVTNQIRAFAVDHNEKYKRKEVTVPELHSKPIPTHTGTSKIWCLELPALCGWEANLDRGPSSKSIYK